MGVALDCSYQVVRHPGLERVGADDECDVPGIAREMQRGLAGRVPATGDVYVLAVQRRSFRSRAAVEDAGAVQALQRGDAEATVPGAGGEDHRPGAHAPPIDKRHVQRSPRATEIAHPMHEEEARPEAQRLLVGLLGESAATDALGEAEVIADVRARSGLAADATLVQHQRAQPVGGAVHRRGKPGRPGTDDDEVERIAFDIGRSAGGNGDLGIGGIAQDLATGKHHHRKRRVRPCFCQQLAPLVRVREAERMWDGAALEHRPQLVRAAGPRLADDVHVLRDGATVSRRLEQEARDRFVKHLIR